MNTLGQGPEKRRAEPHEITDRHRLDVQLATECQGFLKEIELNAPKKGETAQRGTPEEEKEKIVRKLSHWKASQKAEHLVTQLIERNRPLILLKIRTHVIPWVWEFIKDDGEYVLRMARLEVVSAIKKFDPGKDFRFSTYLTAWVRRTSERINQEQTGLSGLRLHYARLYMTVLKEAPENPEEALRTKIAREQAKRYCAEKIKKSRLISASPDESTGSASIQVSEEEIEKRISSLNNWNEVDAAVLVAHEAYLRLMSPQVVSLDAPPQGRLKKGGLPLVNSDSHRRLIDLIPSETNNPEDALLQSSSGIESKSGNKELRRKLLENPCLNRELMAYKAWKGLPLTEAESAAWPELAEALRQKGRTLNKAELGTLMGRWRIKAAEILDQWHSMVEEAGMDLKKEEDQSPKGVSPNDILHQRNKAVFKGSRLDHILRNPKLKRDFVVYKVYNGWALLEEEKAAFPELANLGGKPKVTLSSIAGAIDTSESRVSQILKAIDSSLGSVSPAHKKHPST